MDDARHAAVLVVDVVSSSHIDNFERRRDAALARINDRHGPPGLIARPYTVTAWDEFQTVTQVPAELPTLILDLRFAFAPMSLYVGVGVGDVAGWRSSKPMNEALFGEAFERGREALDHIKARSGKYPRLTAFRTGDIDRDAAIELVYRLHDTLIGQVSERQWETMAAARDADSQEALARQFDVEPSTITRNLRRGHYWQLTDTAQMLRRQFTAGPLALKRTIS